jgi:hypothetical protein
MKTKTNQLLRRNVLLGLLLACAITPSLNSCVATASISYQNYTPPAWAPPYDDVSTVHYYYFPDYDMYYDVWANQFWYQNNGIWSSSADLPPIYGDVNLYNSYIVLVHRKSGTPWNYNDHYTQNYPPHCYDNYQNIVVTNRIVKNTAPNHELVPRAFNENNSRVTFMQRPINNPQNNSDDRTTSDRQVNTTPVAVNQPHQQPEQTVQQPRQVQIPQQPRQTQQPQNNSDDRTIPDRQVNTTPVAVNQPRQLPEQTVQQPRQVQVPQQPRQAQQPQYHNVTQEVPIKSIKPFMPSQSKTLNYGGAFNKQH